MNHEISPTIRGCKCSICGEPAAHKVGEESGGFLGEHGPDWNPTPEAAEHYKSTGQSPPWVHNLTNWLCCKCFGRVMGPFAAARCGVEVPPIPVWSRRPTAPGRYLATSDTNKLNPVSEAVAVLSEDGQRIDMAWGTSFTFDDLPEDAWFYGPLQERPLPQP